MTRLTIGSSPQTQSCSVELKFPSHLWSRILLTPTPERDDVVDALIISRDTYEVAKDMERKISELEVDLLRLSRENEFLIALLNKVEEEWENGED